MSSRGKLWSRGFVIVNLCVIFVSFTNFAFIYILPVHMLAIGGTNTDVGIMGMGLTLVGLVTRLALAPLIDRWGRKRMLVLGCVLFAVNALGYLLVHGSVAGTIVMRCFSGFTQGILFPVPPTIVSDVVDEDRLVDALGFFGIAGSLPAVFAPVVGLYLYERVSPAAFFLLTIVMAVTSTGIALLYEDTYVPQPIKRETREPLRVSSVLEPAIIMPCLIVFLAMVGNSAVNNFALNCGEARSIEGMSLFFTVNNMAIVASRLVAGRLKERLSSRVVVLSGLAVLGAGNLVVAFAYGLPLMLVASALIGVGMTFHSQLLQADTLLMVPESRRGVASSTFMLAQDLGTGFGAAGFGVMAEQLGYAATFVASAVATWLALPVCARAYRKR